MRETPDSRSECCPQCALHEDYPTLGAVSCDNQNCPCHQSKEDIAEEKRRVEIDEVFKAATPPQQEKPTNSGEKSGDATTSPQQEWETTKYQLTQAILGALEYCGFYDCGKYLDDTFLEHIEPIIRDLLAAQRKAERERLLAALPYYTASVLEDGETLTSRKARNDTLKEIRTFLDGGNDQ